MKNDIVFIRTTSHDYGIRASMDVFIGVESFLEEFKKDYNKGIWRLARNKESTKRLMELSISEFENIFPKDSFSDIELKVKFRKDIYEKYAKNKPEKVKYKTIKKKDLKKGYLYKTSSGSTYIYFGKIKYQSKPYSTTYDGEGYFCPNEPYKIPETLEEYFIRNKLYLNGSRGYQLRYDKLKVLKQPTSFVEEIKKVYDIPNQFYYQKNGLYLFIEFLDN